jgi:signal transduction histidine kinase
MAHSGDSATIQRGAEQLSDWLGRAVREGRDALNSLRTHTTQETDLAKALRLVAEDGLKPSSMVFSVSVVGSPRRLHPIVRDEIYRIAYEAIRNACRHSEARRVEVELRYERDVTVRVSDDGIGMPVDVAEHVKKGRFGLQGMRERAARIGAALSIVSSAARGTEITVTVPESVLFMKHERDLVT